MFHLLDEDEEPSSPCPVGSTLAPYTWQMFQGPKDLSLCRGRTYVIILALAEGVQASLIHLETHDDILYGPTPTWGHYKFLLGKNKVPTPYPLCLESISTSWDPLGFIRPAKRPNDSLCSSFNPLERLLIMLLSSLVGLLLIFDSLGGTPSPRVWGLEVGATQKSFVGLEPKVGFLHPSIFGPKP